MCSSIVMCNRKANTFWAKNNSSIRSFHDHVLGVSCSTNQPKKLPEELNFRNFDFFFSLMSEILKYLDSYNPAGARGTTDWYIGKHSIQIEKEKGQIEEVNRDFGLAIAGRKTMYYNRELDTEAIDCVSHLIYKCTYFYKFYF